MSNSGKPSSMVIPSQALLQKRRCRDLMANILLLSEMVKKMKRKSRPTNSESFGSDESHSGKHNPKVIGSSPVPATTLGI